MEVIGEGERAVTEQKQTFRGLIYAVVISALVLFLVTAWSTFMDRYLFEKVRPKIGAVKARLIYALIVTAIVFLVIFLLYRYQGNLFNM